MKGFVSGRKSMVSIGRKDTSCKSERNTGTVWKLFGMNGLDRNASGEAPWSGKKRKFFIVWAIFMITSFGFHTPSLAQGNSSDPYSMGLHYKELHDYEKALFYLKK
jgi:hypothetical protein